MNKIEFNNADLGMTTQKLICDMYGVSYNDYARKSFASSYNSTYVNFIKPIIKKIFNEIGSKPLECTTFIKSPNPFERDLPYNFILANGKTLSIKVNKNKTSAKICPNIVGQCGYEKLNYYFGHLIDRTIKCQEDIKELFTNNIDNALPIFIDYLFIADITVFMYQTSNGVFEYKIVPREIAPDLKFRKQDITFTHIEKNKSWDESTTLKVYIGSELISIAEIQVHKNRTFKFRFSLDKIISLLKKINNTTETLGMSAEKAICDYFSLPYDINLVKRSDPNLVLEIMPCIEEAFKELPKAIEHTGSLPGVRGGASKSSYDFKLKDNKTLSLKTNYGKMVCPPEVGQPGADTFTLYFGHLLNTELNYDIFKELVIKNIDKMMPIYFRHLLDSDYLLWIFKEKNKFNYKILRSINTTKMQWDYNKFTFTRYLDTWLESTTVKYKNISLGEFQVHSSRNCYKFRFNMKNLLKILENEGILL